MILKKYISYNLLFLLVLSIAYAAGGGGGGGSSCSGLCFSQSRTTILLYIKEKDDKQIKLANGNKFDIILNKIEDNKINMGFKQVAETFDINVGTKASVDLDNDNFYDLEIGYVKKELGNAQLRLKDLRNTIPVESEEKNEEIKKDVIVEKTQKEEESSGLKCGNFDVLRERVRCRLNLESEEIEKELELQYLPEECRDLSGNEKGICIARYKSVQSCWKFSGNERISCVKRQINLGRIQDEKEACNKKTGQERAACVIGAKNKVYSLIKWRFYDLEERAEDFMQRGLIDNETAADFVVKVEENKRKFNEAKTKDEREGIILEVRNDWKGLVNKIKEKNG